MKRLLAIPTLLLAVITLSACDTLNSLVSMPPADYTGNYADLNVTYGNVCGQPQTGELHLSISTQVADNASAHTITATAVINEVGTSNETLAYEANWTVDGTANNLNSGAIKDFGNINLRKVDDRFLGLLTIYNVECVTPSTEPGQPDQITYARVTTPFTATAH